uniref:Uncharacterized protein n=1 Tax=Caenorhabditis japonica TaxID=281687 RepID=A0A8R1IX78_CAEJA
MDKSQFPLMSALVDQSRLQRRIQLQSVLVQARGIRRPVGSRFVPTYQLQTVKHGGGSFVNCYNANFPNFIDKPGWPALSPKDHCVWRIFQVKVKDNPHRNDKKVLVGIMGKVSAEYLRVTIDSYPKHLKEVVKHQGGGIELL